MSLAGIDHFIQTGSFGFTNHHLLWIADELFETPQPYNESNNNTGGYPASDLYTFVQSMYNDLPSEWKNSIIAVPRIRDNKSDTAAWYYEDKMIVPSEVEVFGAIFYGSKYAEADKKQWPIFMGGTSRIIKNFNGGNRANWWTSSVAADNSTSFIFVRGAGDSKPYVASTLGGISIAFCTSKDIV